MARDMLREGKYSPVGFLDDKAHFKGAKIHGIPVLGTLKELGQTVNEMDADMVVIAMPAANSLEMQRVVGLCQEIRIPYRTLPRLHDLIGGLFQRR